MDVLVNSTLGMDMVTPTSESVHSNMSEFNVCNMTINIMSGSPWFTTAPTKSMLSASVLFQAVVSQIIILCNIMILITLPKWKLLQTTTKLLIANLAITDVITGIMMNIRLICIEVFVFVHRSACLIGIVFLASPVCINVSGILLISIESYISVNFINIKAFMTKLRTMMVIVASWIFWVIVFAITVAKPRPTLKHNIQCYLGNPYFYPVIVMGILLTIGVQIISVIYIQIMVNVHIKRQLKHLTNIICNQKRTVTVRITSNSQAAMDGNFIKRRLQSVMKTSKVSAAVLTILIVCWLPYITIMILHYTCPSCSVNGLHLHLFSAMLVFNSFANIFVYIIRSKEFREALLNTLQPWKIRIGPIG